MALTQALIREMLGVLFSPELLGRKPLSLFHHCVLIGFDWFSVMIHCIYRKPLCELNNFCALTQQNIGRRFGTIKMHLGPHLQSGMVCIWSLLSFAVLNVVWS